MGIVSSSAVSLSVKSTSCGQELGRALASALAPHQLKAVVVYASIDHDQPALLKSIQDTVGPEVALVGCSSQGLVSRGEAREGGYFAGALGLGGDLQAAVARVDQLGADAAGKGQALGEALAAKVSGPRLVLVYFDPFTGADMNAFLAALHRALPAPIVGGAASQPWGSVVAVYQYAGAEVLSGGAVALALDGDFAVELAASHGTRSLGVERTVTRSQGTLLMELDGEKASTVWQQAIGLSVLEAAQAAALALGIPNPDQPELGAYRVLSPTMRDAAHEALVFFSHFEPGTKVVLHHRTVEGVLDGAKAMGWDLSRRLAGRGLKAVLGFECGARTHPFLGPEATLQENVALQQALGGEPAWLGMMAWGEVLALRDGPAVVNYTYPLACLVDSR